LFLRQADTLIERDNAELQDIQDTADPIRPYWDLILRRDSQARWDLFKKLWDVKLLGFRVAIKAKVGLFFVKKKKPTEIRMVVDARQANRCHRRPPVTRLSSANALVELDMSSEGLDVEGVGRLQAGIAMGLRRTLMIVSGTSLSMLWRTGSGSMSLRR